MNYFKITKKIVKIKTLKIFHHVLIGRRLINHKRDVGEGLSQKCYKCNQLKHKKKVYKSHQQQNEDVTIQSYNVNMNRKKIKNMYSVFTLTTFNIN